MGPVVSHFAPTRPAHPCSPSATPCAAVRVCNKGLRALYALAGQGNMFAEHGAAAACRPAVDGYFSLRDPLLHFTPPHSRSLSHQVVSSLFGCVSMATAPCTGTALLQQLAGAGFARCAQRSAGVVFTAPVVPPPCC